MVSNFALSLVVFKWHHGSEGVKPDLSSLALGSSEFHPLSFLKYRYWNLENRFTSNHNKSAKFREETEHN